MRVALSAILFTLCGSVLAQDQELLDRIDEALRKESERLRGELLDVVRRELGGEAPAPKTAAALVTADLLRKHVTYLASDELEGRASGYPGNVKAAKYIAGVMKQAGLRAAGDNGTFLQQFKVFGRPTANCVGLLEGSDPNLRTEYLVVGAHFDHLGKVGQRARGRLPVRGADKIWNGADDNASGTSTLLGIVRAFAEGGLRPRRSILFIAFSGEEAGLIGSRWYASHPAAPIRNHVFMLNLDMVGRNPHKPIKLFGVGSAAGGVLRRAAERAVEQAGLSADIQDTVKITGGDSDHSSFRQKKVPYSFFFSNFHADYHRPSDHSEKLAYGNMAKVARASVYMLLEIADLEERPVFSGRTAGRLVIPEFLKPARPPRRLGVTVQELDDAELSLLDLPKTQGGLRVDVVHPKTVAESSGVKVGDVVVTLAGKFLPRTGARERLRHVLTHEIRPGREVDLEVLRNSRRVTLKVTWSK